MRDEAADLFQTALWILDVIRTNRRPVLRRIAESYAEAQTLIAAIPRENGSSRPRIVACLERWDVHRAGDELAGAGWLLAAVRERIAEKDVYDWIAIKLIADQAVALLPQPAKHFH